jgi:hypothetical protein
MSEPAEPHDPRAPVDMRGKTPRGIVDVLDAIAIARPGWDRFDVVNEILLKHCRQIAREASVIAKVTQGNPRLVDSDWRPLD